MRFSTSVPVKFLCSRTTRAEGWTPDLLLLSLRLLFGWLLFQTGYGKLTHLERTGEFFASLHLAFPQTMAGVVGGIEAVGGLLLLFGLAARPAALFLLCTLVGALLSAHRADVLQGLDSLVSTPPFPYLLVSLMVLVFGPGRLSLDQLRAGGSPQGRH